MIGLTPNLAKLLSFIKDYVAANEGVSPTHREMAAHMQCPSTSTTYKLVNGLISRGYLRRLPRRSRALELVEPGNPDLKRVTLGALLDEIDRRKSTRFLVEILASRGVNIPTRRAA